MRNNNPYFAKGGAPQCREHRRRIKSYGLSSKELFEIIPYIFSFDGFGKTKRPSYFCKGDKRQKQ